ncbi:hypothetical protein ACQKWADRAFT_314110 [Trichoderma austrokoningii]
MLTAYAFSLLLASAGAWTPQSNAEPRHQRRYEMAPHNDKFRGVNLGSQFTIEPWIASDEFTGMGRGGLNDE